MAKLQKLKTSDVPSRWETRRFGTGGLANILDVEEWRVKNFAMGRAYGLAASSTVGTAKRRIRVFSTCDALKIAVARDLIQFGFSPEAIGEGVKVLDEALLREWAEAAEIESEFSAKSLRYLVRNRERWSLVPTSEPLKFLTDDGGFVFNLPDLVARVVARIKRLEEEGN